MNNQEMLNEIRKATDMGVVGIEAVENRAAQEPLYDALLQQKQEYHELYGQADCMLLSRGGQRKNIPQSAKVFSRMSSAMKLMMGPTDSKIAEMMIEGNTKGMIKSYQNLRTLDQTDPEILTLSRKLLQTELHNIEQMKKFL